MKILNLKFNFSAPKFIRSFGANSYYQSSTKIIKIGDTLFKNRPGKIVLTIITIFQLIFTQGMHRKNVAVRLVV